MAGIGGKKYPLSIVVGTVDRATAGLLKINKQIDRMTAPVRLLNKRLARLGELANISKVGERWKTAGESLAGVGKTVAVGMGLVAAAAGLGAHAIMGMVEANDAVGDSAQRLGLSVDAFLQLRYAAKKSGAEIADLDSGMETFVVGLGKARAGTGKLAGFLKEVSPVLLKQLKATHSTEEAVLLMADAMAKVQDPTKRAALATAAFGGSGIKLADMLARGSGGVKGLMGDFLKLAGSQESAVAQSGELADLMDDMDAAILGVKGSLMGALGPALKTIAEKLLKFFQENQPRIAAWAKDFGEKLPGAINQFVASVTPLWEKFKTLWDYIGGAKGAAEIFAGVLVIKVGVALFRVGQAIASTIGLVSKFSTVLVRMVVASPLAPLILAVMALVAAGYLLWKNWDEIKFAFIAIWYAISDAFTAAWGAIKDAGASVADFLMGIWTDVTSAIMGKIMKVVDLAKGAANWLGFDVGQTTSAITGSTAMDAANAAQRPTLGAASVSSRPLQSEARVMVDFNNMPKGARVTADPKATADIDLSVGYQLAPQ